MCANRSSADGQLFSSSPVDPEDSFRKVLCAMRVDYEYACYCGLPCDEMIYDVAVSASGPWPHEAYREAFYDKYVQRTSHGHKVVKHANDTVSRLRLVSK